VRLKILPLLSLFFLASQSAAVKKNHFVLEGEVIFPSGYPEKDQVVVFKEVPSDFKVKSDKTRLLDQVGYQFAPRLIVAHPGDKLQIKNSDPGIHVVAAYQGPLKGTSLTLLKGQTKILSLKDSGHSEMLCSIHAQMKADVLILSSPWYGISSPEGQFRIPFESLPKFPFSIAAWHPLLKVDPIVIQNLEEFKKGIKVSLQIAP
jgi:plastocyanin